MNDLNDSPCRVESVDNDGYDVYFLAHDSLSYLPKKSSRPIPLTPEILEKCGFENSYKFGMVWHNYLKRYAVVVNGESIENVPQNLHQLQNLYFALTGTELNYTP